MVHVDDLPMISAATGQAVYTVGRRSPGLKALTDAEMRRGVDALVDVLADGPLSTNQLKDALPELGDLRYWLLAAMGEGRVVRADAPHARSNRTRYARTERWIPGYIPYDLPPAEARRRLLARAVDTFGPVTEADLAWWLPAPKGEVARALASLGSEVANVVVGGVRHWFHPRLADAEAPPRDTHGAWLLPYEDGLLKGYQDRGWLLAPGLREVLFPFSVEHWHPPAGVSPGPGPHKGVNVSGEARPSIWWGGRVVGRWEEREADVAKPDDKVAWRVHVDIGSEAQEAIATEIARLERFLVAGLGPISAGPTASRRVPARG